MRFTESIDISMQGPGSRHPSRSTRGVTRLIQEEAMTSTINKKSGQGLSDGVVSELATFWEVLPGHEDELRAATERFAGTLSAGRPGQEPPHRPAGPAPRDLRQRDADDVGHDVRERLGPLLRRLRPDRHPPLPGLDGAHHPVHARRGVAPGVRRGGQVPPGQPRHRGADEAQRPRPQGDRPVGAEPGDRLLQQPARVHDAGDRQGPARERGVPAGAGRSCCRGGAGTSGAEAAAGGGRDDLPSLAAHPSPTSLGIGASKSTDSHKEKS